MLSNSMPRWHLWNRVIGTSFAVRGAWFAVWDPSSEYRSDPLSFGEAVDVTP